MEAVLTDIEKSGEVEGIYCLGDLIGIGHESNEVLEMIFSRPDIHCVLGNHDEAIVKILDGQEPRSKGEEAEHHKWIAERIDPAFHSLLSSLPKSIEANIDGKKLLFLHYHLSDDGDFLPLDHAPSAQTLDSLYSEKDADIVCFGHHHTIHFFKSKQSIYINPGSIGCSHDSLASYAIIEFEENGAVNVSFKSAAYDSSEFLQSFEKPGVPARQFILNVFYGGQHLK